jgi:hypothetical protein
VEIAYIIGIVFICIVLGMMLIVGIVNLVAYLSKKEEEILHQQEEEDSKNPYHSHQGL